MPQIMPLLTLIWQYKEIVMTQNVRASITSNTSGIMSSSTLANALKTSSLNGGDSVVDYLKLKNDLMQFIKVISTYTDDNWSTVKNEETGIPLSYVAADLGGKEARLEITYNPENYSLKVHENDEPKIQKMVTISISIGGSTFNKATLITSISAGALSIAPLIMGFYLRGVRKGIQKALARIDKAQFDVFPNPEEAEALTESDEAVRRGAYEALDEAREAEEAALKDVAFDLTVADGCMFAVVTIAVVAGVFSFIAHTTNYTFSIENRTEYDIVWSEPEMKHGDMNSAPTDGKGGFEYTIPALANTSPEGYTPQYTFTVANFSFIEKKALYGVTGSMNLKFVDDKGNTIETANIAFNIPYSGANGMGFAFGADKAGHENKDEVESWELSNPSGQLTVNAGISALHGKHTLPGMDKGYNYSSTITYTQSKNS